MSCRKEAENRKDPFAVTVVLSVGRVQMKCELWLAIEKSNQTSQTNILKVIVISFQHIPGTAFDLAYKNILTTRTAKLVRWLQVQFTTSLLTAV